MNKVNNYVIVGKNNRELYRVTFFSLCLALTKTERFWGHINKNQNALSLSRGATQTASYKVSTDFKES